MRLRLQWLCLALAALLALVAPAHGQSAGRPQVDAGIREIKKYGNLVLDISGSALLAQGFDYGDIITATLGGVSLDMPVCREYSDADVGAPVCRVTDDGSADGSTATLAINGGDLATWLGIADRADTDEAPGYRWDYAEGWSADVRVRLALKEKGGYLQQLELHNLPMTNEREDYPDLSDEQYANFRAVATTGMGANALYRSSSPVNPKYNRNRQADAALKRAGIRCVVNLSDSEVAMKDYEGYGDTCYSTLDVLPLNLIVNYDSDAFRAGLAEGFRFIAENEGPCLVHCNKGKDRTGFACAVLECLMGASGDEVVADYMSTYANFYGVRPGDESYEAIANTNIRQFLATAFGVERLEGEDLAGRAEAYLAEIGMTDGEIAALKARLGTDIQ